MFSSGRRIIRGTLTNWRLSRTESLEPWGMSKTTSLGNNIWEKWGCEAWRKGSHSFIQSFIWQMFIYLIMLIEWLNQPVKEFLTSCHILPTLLSKWCYRLILKTMWWNHSIVFRKTKKTWVKSFPRLGPSSLMRSTKLPYSPTQNGTLLSHFPGGWLIVFYWTLPACGFAALRGIPYLHLSERISVFCLYIFGPH